MKQVVKITVTELSEMASKMYITLVKGVVDVDRKLLVVDAEMHVDEEQYLLENGSSRENLWGINLYPVKYETNEFIEFNSMINIRPSQNNNSRTVQDPQIKEQIRKLIKEIVHE